MSDAIKHECGIAMVRLLKPLEYYQQKYGSAFYGFNKLYLLMEKQLKLPMEEMTNVVKKIYQPFGAEEISAKIGEILTTDTIKTEVQFIYQKIEDLHAACPNHLGDWYFTGNYPTPGGNKVVNQAYVNYIEGNKTRAYVGN
jgi:amidophosphoribosyltransferase